MRRFRGLKLPLVVVGEGNRNCRRLRRRATPECSVRRDVRSDEAVADYLERCKAFVFAANEDFGIVPVEAQAAGAPVIAFGEGGATENRRCLEVTGLFFHGTNSGKSNGNSSSV